jgi:hypothetical protein
MRVRPVSDLFRSSFGVPFTDFWLIGTGLRMRYPEIPAAIQIAGAAESASTSVLV